MDRRLLILAVGMFAMGTDNFVVAGILPGVAASLNTSVSLAGLMVTFYALTYAVAAPVMAALAGGWPRKLLLVSALGIFVAGNTLSAVATDLHWVLLSPGSVRIRRSAVLAYRIGRCLGACTARKTRPCVGGSNGRIDGSNRARLADRHVHRRIRKLENDALVRHCCSGLWR